MGLSNLKGSLSGGVRFDEKNFEGWNFESEFSNETNQFLNY